MKRSYLDYAMSVIVARALPDVRDGLKPVHRRILYSMKVNGNEWNRAYRKSARIVGDVIGKYHPHGELAIYDAMVRMAQDFAMRLPLIDGQGNFGSMDGDPPAAYRYTEARLARVADTLLDDLDKDTVAFQPNYDDTEQEPKVLPAGFPNLLINGGSGIAVGMATNIPPHNLREVIGPSVDHHRKTIVRRTKFELRRAEERAHVLEGLLVALDNLDEVIALIRSSRDPEAARNGLLERFELTIVQAQAILQLTLSRLTALEADKIKQEHADLIERIRELREILGDESRVLALIKEELSEIAETYGDDRRTEIVHAEGEIDIEDLIADQQMVISITHSGYVKSLPLSTYRQQRRGGVGVTGMDMKEDDYIEHLFVSSTHDYLLFFTNRGKVYRLKVYELPEASRTSRGRALGNLLPLREGERVQSVLSTRDFTEGKYLVFATRKGMIKKTEFGGYNTPIKADGIIAINIRDDDELVAVRRTSGHDDIIMISRSGQAARFSEAQVRGMGRDTSGVRGMNVSQKDNHVLAMDVARDDQELLVVTENGYGKRTPIPEYPVKGRGTMGVKTITLTENKGQLAGALVVREHQELVFISQNGMVQRTSVRGINRYGRTSQGVRVMNMREDDQVSAVALIVESEAATAAPVVDGDPLPGIEDA